MDDVEKIDVELFLTEVEKRGAIWDFRKEEYKDRNKKEAAWYEICLLLVPNFTKHSKPGKKLICRKVQQKWRNIRDYHRKYTIKLRKSGTGSAKKFKYVYDDKLRFLTSLLGSTVPVTNQQDEEIHEMVEPEVFLTDDNSDDQLTFSGQIKLEDIPVLPTIKAEKIKSETTKSELEGKVCKFFDNLPMPLPFEDEDRLFLDSLLPTLRTFDTDQKLEFRVEVLRVMQHIRQAKLEAAQGFYVTNENM